MKKLMSVILLVVLLTGCSPVQTFETIADVYAPQDQAAPRKIALTIPKDAEVWTLENAGNKLYFCDGYEIAVETLTAGDLNKTLLELTGFGTNSLTILETGTSAVERYECVWTASAENGDQVGRVVILSDGNYHYCLTMTADARESGSLQEVWQEVSASFALQS